MFIVDWTMGRFFGRCLQCGFYLTDKIRINYELVMWNKCVLIDKIVFQTSYASIWNKVENTLVWN